MTANDTWLTDLGHQHNAGNLTQGQHDCLAALRSFAGPRGCFPARASIAARAGMSLKSVDMAHAVAIGLGILLIRPRRRRLRPDRRQHVQDTNQYYFRPPTGPVERRPRPRWHRSRKSGGSMPAPTQASKQSPALTPAEIELAQVHLAAVAARRAALLTDSRAARPFPTSRFLISGPLRRHP